MYMYRCMTCMNEIDSYTSICPHCGADCESENEGRYLPQGTKLNKRYIVGTVADFNSIFVTYNCWDTKDEVKVYIDEFLPEGYCQRKDNEIELTIDENGEDKFFAGARAFADECNDLINIKYTDIIDGFDENDTSYAVRKIINGVSLSEIVDDDYEIDNEYINRVIAAVLRAIAPVHKLGIIHGNITPDTLIVDEKGTIILTDFSFCGYMSRFMPVYTNESYSPLEQYAAGEKLTTKVDIYSIGAVFYELITGEMATDVLARRSGEKLIPIDRFENVTLNKNICSGIMSCLSLEPQNRPESAETLFDLVKNRVAKPGKEKYTPPIKEIQQAEKQRGKKVKVLVYALIAILLVCVAVIAYDVISIKKSVDAEKKKESEVSTEAPPDEGESIFDIFKNRHSEETSEETTEEETKSQKDDEVTSGSGVKKD